MTFDLETAKRIQLYYSFLIGRPINESMSDHKITDLVIVPIDDDQFGVCISSFNQNVNNQLSLLNSGFDKSAVRIVVVCRYNGDIFHKDLDTYLTKFGIDKTY